MANNPPAPELPDFVIQNLADAIINKLNSLDLAEREHANFRRLLQSELKIEPAFLIGSE